MTIEATLQAIAETLKAIHTTLASGAAVSASAPAAAPAPAPAEVKAEKPPEVEKPKKEKASAPAPAPTPAAVNWDADVMPVLKKISSSAAAGHGRDGLTKLITHFTDGKGTNVPAVAAVNRHAEVLAYAKALLAGEPLPGAAAEDDLGLGI